MKVEATALILLTIGRIYDPRQIFGRPKCAAVIPFFDRPAAFYNKIWPHDGIGHIDEYFING